MTVINSFFDLTNVQYVKENIFIGITLEQLVVQGGPKNKVKIIVGPLNPYKMLTRNMPHHRFSSTKHIPSIY